jgi:hypothetical protein
LPDVATEDRPPGHRPICADFDHGPPKPPRTAFKPLRGSSTTPSAWPHAAAFMPAYTHIHVRTAEPRILDRPHELLTTPLLIESSSRVVERPEGSAEKIGNVLWKTCFGILLVTWVKGLALIYASLVKHPYRSVATYFMTNGSIRSADR